MDFIFRMSTINVTSNSKLAAALINEVVIGVNVTNKLLDPHLEAELLGIQVCTIQSGLKAYFFMKDINCCQICQKTEKDQDKSSQT